MTQTLMDERIAPLSARAAAPAATGVSKFGTFAITFGIAFVILYTLFERMNWPLFTYHPAVDRWDFGRYPGRPEEGPPMFWYGWIVLAAAASVVVGWIATFVSRQWLERATVFCCVSAVLWTIGYELGNYIADQASFNADFLRPVWVSAIPALVCAAAASYFVSAPWAQRLWTSWLLIMPIAGLVLLGYSLKQYFLR